MQIFPRSYVYSVILDQRGVYSEKIKNILISNQKKNISSYLTKSLNDIVKIYKDKAIIKAVHEVQLGNIKLYVLPENLQLPMCLPFIKYRDKNGERVFIDMSKFVNEKNIGGDIEYEVDLRQLYTLILSAYITLQFVDESTVLSTEIMRYSAIVWAKIFCKVLNQTIGLSTNKDKYYAYMYMTMKFYLLKQLHAPEPVAESICSAYVGEFYQGKKELNYFLNNMTRVIEERQYKPFDNIEQFCYTMFSDEVSGTSGIRAANIADNINITAFFKKYMTMYGASSVMALGSWPYFMMMIISANNQAGIVNDRSLKDIVKEDEARNVVKLMSSIYKEI